MNGKARKGPLNVFCVFMAFVTAFLLTGCGGTGKEKTAETDAPVRQEMIWQGEGFGEIMSATEGSPVYLVDYQQGIEELPDLSGEGINDIHSLYLGFYQDKIYLLTCSFIWTSIKCKATAVSHR